MLWFFQALSEELSEKYDGYLEPVKCDVRKESDIKNMFNLIESKYGGLDVCVNNAGLYQDAPLLSGSTEDWREMLEVFCVIAVAIYKHFHAAKWLIMILSICQSSFLQTIG